MAKDVTTHVTPTRREYVKYGGAVVGGGLLAGCSGGQNTESTPSESDTRNDSELTEDESYSVTMSPAGNVEFEQAPENVFTVLPHHAEMTVAVGQGDTLNSVFSPQYNHTLWNKFLDQIPGISVDWADFPNSWNPPKELLYELDSDLHLADPVYMTTTDRWERSDIEEVRENVAPFFGNAYSDANRPAPDWASDYQYYTLWEIFEKVAKVFQAGDRYEALSTIHNEVRSIIEANLPPEDERPRVARVFPSFSEKSMWVYTLNGSGFYRANTRPLGAIDAFSDLDAGTSIDYEALIEADPDVMLILGIPQDSNMAEVREQLESNPTTRSIPAVENDRVHTSGTRIQGPIVNLLQLEMTAKQLYPEQFGEWPTYVDGPYPKPEAAQLFDRQRVADIINGNF